MSILQLRSAQRYLGEGFGGYHVVWNEPGSAPPELVSAALDLLGPERVRFWSSEELGISERALTSDGWTTQQVAKLQISEHIQTELYLVLDAKNFFVRPTTASAFVAEDGRAFGQLGFFAGTEAQRFAAEYFGLTVKPGIDRWIEGVTPFTLHTASVRALVRKLVDMEGCSLSDAFFRHHGKMAEFVIYQGFVESQGRTIANSYVDCEPRGDTLWVHDLREPRRMDDWVSRVGKGKVPVAGFHWAAASTASAAQRKRIAELWRELGLVENVAEGEATIRATYSNLNLGDHRFLRKVVSEPPPNISVVVPVYNKGPYVAECLESILNQPNVTLEVICVDDGSTDESLAVLIDFAARYDCVRVVAGSSRRGPGACRNQGLEFARGEFVQFVDADDILPMGCLAKLLVLAQSDRVDAARGGVEGFDGDDPSTCRTLMSRRNARAVVAGGNADDWLPWWHTTYLFRRAFLAENDLRYPDLVSGEDPVFLAEFMARGPNLSSSEEVVYRYRMAPLANKGRRTARHLFDYLRHFEIVKTTQLRWGTGAWNQYGFHSRGELLAMIADFPLDAAQRAKAELHFERILLDSEPVATPLRLAILYHVCGLGGVETALLRRAEVLRARGIEVRLVFGRPWGEGSAYILAEPGVSLHSDPEQIRTELDEFCPDVVAIVDSPHFVPTAKAVANQPSIVYETHVSDPDALESRVLCCAADSRIGAICVPSQFNRELLEARGVEGSSIHVISNSVDVDSFASAEPNGLLERLGVPRGIPLVGFVGRMEPQKNVLEFVRAGLAVVAEGVTAHFVVLGDTVDRPDYLAEVTRAAAESAGAFSFVERVGPRDMPSFFAELRVSGGCLVSTSLFESQPMVMLEAQAASCPVVASDVGGVRRVVTHERTGLLYPLGQPMRAAAAVVRLLRDPELRKRIVDAGAVSVRGAHGGTGVGEYAALTRCLARQAAAGRAG